MVDFYTNRKKQYYKFISIWGVLFFDLATLLITLLFTAKLNLIVLSPIEFAIHYIAYALPILIIKPHQIIIRYATAVDLIKILYVTLIGFVLGLAFYFFIGNFANLSIASNLNFIIDFFFIASFSLICYRLLVSIFRRALKKQKSGSENLMIFGAGELGQTVLEVLKKEKRIKVNIIGFIDDSPKLYRKQYRGIPIYTLLEAMSLAKEKQLTEIILAINKPNISAERILTIKKECLERGITFKQIPEIKGWIDGDIKQAVKIRIEDLLERESIETDKETIKKALQNNCVLITGAAGSIGREIVLQIALYNVKKIILVDNAETPLASLEQEIKKIKGIVFKIELADVSDKNMLNKVFEKYKPVYVFHAAAYKHVPMMERTPINAIKVNVLGTKNLADLSVKHNVKKFVMVSTDKAVNPTNIMGASKRLCEIYIQSLALKVDVKTSFITTRFGNVLGSNGSVVPIFRTQIEMGGPVTVTHRDITRYFMTIPEACSLVLEAGITGNNGEIYVFDMGEPVKIYHLAKKMIRMAGYEPDIDIHIDITGLRPGEKLYEELLSNEENTIPTHHPKILKARVRTYDYDTVNKEISEMIAAMYIEDNVQQAFRIKALVPEYTSKTFQF